MSIFTERESAVNPARWIGIVAAMGLAWNGYGVYRFMTALGAGPADLMASGLDAEQAAAYAALPVWTTVAFAVGVFGGLIGCGLLAAHRRMAFPLLTASAFAYVGLFAGDAIHGIFRVIPQQLPLIGLVVVIAFGLLAVASFAKHRNLLK